jgi:hypothetical protein
LGEIAESPCRERLGDGGGVTPHGSAEEPAESLWIARRRQIGVRPDTARGGSHVLTLGQFPGRSILLTSSRNAVTLLR